MTKKPIKKECRFPHARSHPVLHPADLFRPVRRGRKERPKVKRVRKTHNGSLTTQAFDELDTADQTLMLAIFAIAKSQQMRLLIEINDDNQELLKPLKMAIQGFDRRKNQKVDLSQIPAIQIRIKGYTLLRECGKNYGGEDYKWLREALSRLGGVSFIYEGSEWSGMFNLLAWTEDKRTDEFLITINPISAYSIGVSTAYVYSNMSERLKLSDIGQLLHFRLVGLIRQDEFRNLKINTLASYVWGDSEPVSDFMVRKRRTVIKKAISDIGNLKNWNVEFVGRGKTAIAKIHRLKTNQVRYFR